MKITELHLNIKWEGKVIHYMTIEELQDVYKHLQYLSGSLSDTGRYKGKKISTWKKMVKAELFFKRKEHYALLKIKHKCKTPLMKKRAEDLFVLTDVMFKEMFGSSKKDRFTTMRRVFKNV